MREHVQAVSRALGAFVFSLVLALRWGHAQFIKPTGGWLSESVLPVFEETTKAFVREWFAVFNRNLNTTSAFVLALFSGRSYRGTAARHAAEKQAAWQRWWQSAATTFNALIEQEGLTAEPSGSGSDDSGGPNGSHPPQRQQGGGGSSSSSSKGAAPLRLLRTPRSVLQRTPSNGSVSNASSSSRPGSRWRFWRWRRGGGGTEDGAPATPDLRRGSALFELPSGFAVSQMISRRGLLEDSRVGAEVAVGRAFAAARRLLRRVLWLDGGGDGGGASGGRLACAGSDTDSPADLLARRMRCRTPPPLPVVAEEEAAAMEAAAAAAAAAAEGSAATARAPRRRALRPPLKSLLRSGRHWEEDLSVWTASDVILREGYPLEQHSVTTSDGYVLQMHRIPRHGGRDVVFFQHGVLDTSLGWVANGVVGSAAFAAFDAGFDVWLGNSRSNAPRLHMDAEKQGSRYWRYSMNELGLLDTTAEINHIHNTKMAELAVPGRHSAAAMEQQQQMQRAATDSLLDALRWVDVHTQGSSSGGGGGGGGGGTGGVGPEQGSVARAEQEVAEQEQHVEQQAQGQGQQQGPRRSSDAPQWWQRLTGRTSTAAPRQDLGMGPARGAAAAPLRRTQSASEPLQHAQGQQGAGHIAVPISMPQQQGQGQGQGPSSSSSNAAGAAGQDVLPYRLQAVGHSLGAATLLIYAVGSRMRGQPHRLRRLILMSPAGFHPTVPLGMRACTWLFPAIVWLLDRTPGLRGRGMGLRLPSPLLRYLAFKFTMDLRHMPALHDLVKAGMRMMMSGDSSQWDAALQMPHYSTYSMPALSLHSGAHFAQWSNDLSFRLFDYGTAAANRERYGTDRPPSIADHYRLLDIPVDLLAGAADGIIPPACVIRHVHHLRAAAVPCSFRILPLGHMDFTLAVKDDIRLFVLAKLRQPLP